jgi:hypothetical protein
MAQPDYVPTPTADDPRVYTSPPWRPDSWMADRPAELEGRQPTGPRLGSPGPDQGYAMKIAEPFRERLVLTAGESADDALGGCIAIAMRRASIFGRAPTVHDLTVAFSLWGYLGEAPAELTDRRRELFAGVGHLHHYMERRAIVDGVPEDLLRLPHAEVAALGSTDPARLIAMADEIHAGADEARAAHDTADEGEPTPA